jgi:hypothetical protein
VDAAALLLDVDGIDISLASLDSVFLHVALGGRELKMNGDERRKQR